jgi:two-component system sensor histidine kinase EvgS
VLLDQLRLQQVIINLLSNAIKFSKAHDIIKVEVTCDPQHEIQSRYIIVHVKVTDKGIGISSQDLKNMFKPFFKTTEAQNRMKNKGSHGLGLSICKTIVTSMNG